MIRVGGNEKIKLDIQLIVATHKNLLEEVKLRNFREDLYYRIVGLPIELPPLRDRGKDVLILAKFFVDQFVKENKLKPITIGEHAKEKLLRYQFPGNIRELKSITDLAVVMCDGKEIKANDIIIQTAWREDTFMTEIKTLRGYNIDIIKHFLKRNNSDVVLVAKLLDIGKSTIYKMIQDGELN